MREAASLKKRYEESKVRVEETAAALIAAEETASATEMAAAAAGAEVANAAAEARAMKLAQEGSQGGEAAYRAQVSSIFTLFRFTNKF